ncbi:hypothetical protein [Anaplasma marginale]|uniref:hypothetical protein n=1 Tax=Anaplasma marginale TaxID=770 RepID=UPI001F09FDBE|nr:hypothetical protein [Anaplasma marginale]
MMNAEKQGTRNETVDALSQALRAKAIDTAWRFVIVCQTGQSMTKHTSSAQLDVELQATNGGNGMELTLKFKVREGVELQPLEQVFSECADRCVAVINRLNTERSQCAAPGLTGVANLTAGMQQQQQHVPAPGGTELAEPAITTLAAAGMQQPAPSTALTGVAAGVATPSTALGV